MCGRYAMDDKTNTLVEEYVRAGGRPQDWVRDFHAAWEAGAESPLERSVDLDPARSGLSGVDVHLEGWVPNYNLAPTNAGPIVRDRAEGDDGSGGIRRQFELAQWGFWPSFVKPGDKRPHPINARLETVATNGMFRPSFQSKRCVVPMLGYYEWGPREEGGKTVKQPHFIHPGRTASGEAAGYLSAAGLWTARKDDDGEWLVTYTIITRAARDASGEIHDRMPVFLTDDVVDDWLSPQRLADPESMLEAITRASGTVASEMVTHPVSREVNDVRRADRLDPKLMAPIDA